MTVVMQTAGGVAGVLGLYCGAEILVRGGSRIAEKCQIPALVVGLTLVAFATSAPEMVVSVQAALMGNADISLGNVVGSNICNIALILGLSALIRPLGVARKLLRVDVPIMIGSALLLVFFYAFTHGVNRLQGAFFFTLIVVYTTWSIRQARRGVRETVDSAISPIVPGVSLLAAIVLVVGGLGLLIVGSRLFVGSAIYFARLLEISDAVIGLTIVAVGTSLPELATSVVAACKGEQDIAIGNVVGSNIFNILAILGIAPLIAPLRNATLGPLDLGLMLFCSILLLPVMRTGWKISRVEGAFFLLIYAGYVTFLIVCPR